MAGVAVFTVFVSLATLHQLLARRITDPMKAIRPQSATAEPLRHDIRLLGRLLGKVIQACEGERVFDTIETLRRTAVRFRREGKEADGKMIAQRVKRLRDNDHTRRATTRGKLSQAE